MSTRRSTLLEALMCTVQITLMIVLTLPTAAGVKKVLKPNEYQDFPLKEKTIISHNVAMSVDQLVSSRKKRD